MKTTYSRLKRRAQIESLKAIAVPLLVCLLVAVLCGFVGYAVRASSEAAPHEGVWIELENLQHAIDSASKLGGRTRGLSVCMQKKEDEPITIWNPGIDVHGDLRRCGYTKRIARVAMEIAPRASTELTGLTFDSTQPASSTTYSWTIGGAIRNNRISGNE